MFPLAPSLVLGGPELWQPVAETKQPGPVMTPVTARASCKGLY